MAGQSHSGISADAVAQFASCEQETFIARNPASVALAERAGAVFPGGVPMHWMADWSTPVPLFVERAKGARFTDADGNERLDFCLGDTGAMFGHSPEPVAAMIARQAANGLTVMLPSRDGLRAGELLSERFGLPFWQVTATATDANRSVIRLARAITGRKVILVFDGCYHGTADDTMVRHDRGRTRMRPGLTGQVHDLTLYARAIPFNDPDALKEALATHDVAALICEPAMTNIGMVLPDDGFMETCRSLTRKAGTLLIIDETHTISTGYGGCTREWGLEPDFFVMGKPVAGGVAAGVYGMTADMAERAAAARRKLAHDDGFVGHGHSGMGTTLSANALAMAAMRVNLEEVMTRSAYAVMLQGAARLAEGLRRVIGSHALPWSVTELGARTEFQFCNVPPRTGAEAEAAFDDPLQMALHLALINRGFLITPFHNMMLCCPQTSHADIDALCAALDDALATLLAIPGARTPS